MTKTTTKNGNKTYPTFNRLGKLVRVTIPGAPVEMTPAQVMHAMEKRQEAEGFSHGYISHEIRQGKGNSYADEAVIITLVLRGFDLQDIYAFLNSRTGRFTGDALTFAKATDRHGFFTALMTEGGIPYETPEAMYKDFREAKDNAHNWAGQRVALTGEFAGAAEVQARNATRYNQVASALREAMSGVRMIVEATGKDTGTMTDAQVVAAFQGAMVRGANLAPRG